MKFKRVIMRWNDKDTSQLAAITIIVFWIYLLFVHDIVHIRVVVSFFVQKHENYNKKRTLRCKSCHFRISSRDDYFGTFAAVLLIMYSNADN